ncbi:unnamed protein product [Brassica rapa subsp. trilocularis]
MLKGKEIKDSSPRGLVCKQGSRQKREGSQQEKRGTSFEAHTV